MILNNRQPKKETPMSERTHHNTRNTFKFMIDHHWKLGKFHALTQCILSGLCARSWAIRKSLCRQEDQANSQEGMCRDPDGKQVICTNKEISVFREKENRELEGKQDQINDSRRAGLSKYFINSYKNILIAQRRDNAGNF